MRALILNDRPWHYECYIHIIDFCIEYNIEVDILEAYSDSLGVKEFYLNHFRDNIRYVKGVNKLKDKCLADPFTNIKYDKVFVVTDNFIETIYLNHFKSLKFKSSADDQLILLKVCISLAIFILFGLADINMLVCFSCDRIFCFSSFEIKSMQ